MDGIETLKRLDAIKSELEGVRMNSSKAIDSSSTDTKKMVDTIENMRDSLSVILTWQFKELQKTLDFLKKDSLDERKDKEIEKQKDKKELDKFKLTSDTGIKSNNPLTILSSMMGNMKSMMTLGQKDNFQKVIIVGIQDTVLNILQDIIHKDKDEYKITPNERSGGEEPQKKTLLAPDLMKILPELATSLSSMMPVILFFGQIVPEAVLKKFVGQMKYIFVDQLKYVDEGMTKYGQNLEKIPSMMLKLSISMLIIAGQMMLFGFVQPEAIGNFLSTMFILGAGIVVISLLGDKASKGSWTMLIIQSSMVIASASLWLLAQQDQEKIKTAQWTLIGTFFGVQLMAAGLALIGPLALAGAGAMALLGLALVLQQTSLVIFVKALDMFSKLDIITLAGKLIGFAINVLPVLVVVAIGMAFMMPFMIPATISSVLLIGLFTFLVAGFTILSIVNMDKANKQLKTLQLNILPLVLLASIQMTAMIPFLILGTFQAVALGIFLTTLGLALIISQPLLLGAQVLLDIQFKLLASQITTLWGQISGIINDLVSAFGKMVPAITQMVTQFSSISLGTAVQMVAFFGALVGGLQALILPLKTFPNSDFERFQSSLSMISKIDTNPIKELTGASKELIKSIDSNQLDSFQSGIENLQDTINEMDSEKISSLQAILGQKKLEIKHTTEITGRQVLKTQSDDVVKKLDELIRVMDKQRGSVAQNADLTPVIRELSMAIQKLSQSSTNVVNVMNQTKESQKTILPATSIRTDNINQLNRLS